MSCYHPIKAFRTPDGVVFDQLARHDILGDIALPCGRCIGCRARRAKDWTLRVQHEASTWPSNCFVTLTYARDRLPPLQSLEHRDFQLFLKRTREQTKTKIRYYMCGEYGPKQLRPHYHACLFNIDFRADRYFIGKSDSGYPMYRSPTLEKLWGHGLTTVQDLTQETAGYAARYIMKKALGQDAETAYQTVDPDTGQIHQRKPEYSAMSLKPGIGAAWLANNYPDVYTHDYVVAAGTKHQAPKYYDRLIKRTNLVDHDQIEQARINRAKLAAPDQTDARRQVREQVHKARVTTLKRNLE